MKKHTLTQRFCIWAAVAAVTLTTASAGLVAAYAAPGTATASTAVPANPWVPTNTAYAPSDFTQEPLVGNGYLAQRVPAIGAGFQGAGTLGTGNWPLYNQRSTTALVAGVYQTSDGSDYVSTLPTWSDLSFGAGGHSLDPGVPTSQIHGYHQALDMSTGTVNTSFTWTPASSQSASVAYTVLANRASMHLGQVQASITPSWTGTMTVTSLLNGQGAQRITASSHSVDTTTDTSTVQLATPGRNTGVAETSRLVAGPGVTVSARTAVLPSTDAATAGETWTVSVTAGTAYTFTKYVGISTSNDAGTPLSVAQDTVNQAVTTGWSGLLSSSNTAWATLWTPNITVNGQTPLQEAEIGAYYLLYASLRGGVNYSIPPAGLSSDNYGGEIFWDADTWMFPSILALHPELAKSIVMFRFNTIAAAEANAKSAGYHGGSWAWDNGPTGTCGGLAPCSNYEDHLQSDIALAQWQYYQATGDRSWLSSYGYPVMKDIAQFWASRVTVGSDNKYHINNVEGPDEYTSGVNDESATNAGAIIALRDATAAANVLGQTPDPSWTTIAANISIATDPDGTHPEYPGYTNQSVKQADTVLMSYPLGYVADNTTAAADLNRYMPVTDTGGPAMTASVEAVIAAQTKQPGCLDYTLFQDAYLPFLRGAYDQFNETQYLTPSAGQSNPAFDFATGAGGFLQTFTYGFAGLRWGTKTLTLAPTLPPQLATGITINGLQYQGRTLTVAIGVATTTVTLNSGSPITLQTPIGTRTLTSTTTVTLPTARPDLTATDNAARCQNATASSWQAVDPPAAAVDGNPVTTWTAASTTSTYTVTLPSPVQTGHIDIEWGPTRPANYTVQIKSPSGTWQQVASGSVPTTGSLYTTWTPVATSALKLTFTAGGDASIAELTMPNAVVPDGATVEAEDAILSGGAGVATDHANYTGGGFVDGLYSGADITANYSIPAAGAYQVTIRYANSTGGQNPPYQNVTRTISLVGSGTTQQVSLPVTGSWDTWSTATTTVDLPAGTDTIQLLVGPNDSGSINIDSVTVH